MNSETLLVQLQDFHALLERQSGHCNLPSIGASHGSWPSAILR